MSIVVEHHIQRDIIIRLAHADSLRFSDLKLGTVENNSFMYHMKNLQSLGLVEQRTDKRYCLSVQGLSYVDSLTWSNKKPRKQPKLLSILALQNSAGQYAMAYRKTQPTIDTWMLPSGKQHFGETLHEHAERELKEQFNLELPLKRRGICEIKISHNATLVTHIVAHVYHASYDGDLPAKTEKFRYGWLAPETSEPLTPGTAQLLQALQTDDNFLVSLDVDSD